MNINDILYDMRQSGRQQDMRGKGDSGEEAVLQLCLDRKRSVGNGLLFQSFKYPYQTNRQGQPYIGNIFYDIKTRKFSHVTKDSLEDEIDILYVTPYRIFAIEVKSYHTKTIEVYDAWMNRYGEYDDGSGKKKRGTYPVNKSAVAQAEKHARHLYHAIYDMIPDGDYRYIVPMVCFVDRCVLRDDRKEELQEYLPVCILNTFLATFNKANKPLTYNLDLDKIDRKLHQVCTSIKKELT